MNGVLSVACAFLAACGPHDIVVVELPPPDGGLQMMGKRCTDNTECHPNEFCEKATCGATGGNCRNRPLVCPPEASPVCGCNGVTYWNDCMRRSAGQATATADECATPASCTTGGNCPDPQASCAHLLPSTASCAASPAGVCWVVPRTCPNPTPGEGAWETCGGASLCGTLCTAIRSEQIRRPVDFCP